MAKKTAISSNKKSTITKSGDGTATLGIYKSICKTLDKTPLIGRLVAEFIGAFLLTAAFVEMQGNPLFVGFALAGIVLVIGGVSGAHVNPAVTIGAWVTRRIGWIRALSYIVVQLLGATVAYLVLNTFLHANSSATASAAPKLLSAAEIVKGKEWYLFFAELLGSAVLVLGVATAIRAKGNKIVAAFSAGFGILLALYLAMSLTSPLLVASNVTLTFLNPAIAFAANGLSWSEWPLSIFVLAPLLGGIVGFVLQEFFHSQDNSCECNECK
jgi:glycerol uptake facilitator-like aquaporin